MVCHLYKFECLTSLHVGSGEANYNIIDNEVERDPITLTPIIHSSGLKGALRAHFENKKMDQKLIEKIFGKPTTANDVGAGLYKFFDAKLLARPMRVSNGDIPSINVTSFDIINSYLKSIEAFGCNPYSVATISAPKFNDAEFLANREDITIEDEKTDKLDDNTANVLKLILDNDKFAVAKTINNYPLPVIAHNKLENGLSKNLWYEEYVPADSIFTFMIMTPNENMDLPIENEIIQLGANASIGYGYVKVTKLK